MISDFFRTHRDHINTLYPLDSEELEKDLTLRKKVNQVRKKSLAKEKLLTQVLEETLRFIRFYHQDLQIELSGEISKNRKTKKNFEDSIPTHSKNLKNAFSGENRIIQEQEIFSFPKFSEPANKQPYSAKATEIREFLTNFITENHLSLLWELGNMTDHHISHINQVQVTRPTVLKQIIAHIVYLFSFALEFSEEFIVQEYLKIRPEWFNLILELSESDHHCLFQNQILKIFQFLFDLADLWNEDSKQDFLTIKNSENKNANLENCESDESDAIENYFVSLILNNRRYHDKFLRFVQLDSHPIFLKEKIDDLVNSLFDTVY